jgi:hypothetical protein
MTAGLPVTRPFSSRVRVAAILSAAFVAVVLAGCGDSGGQSTATVTPSPSSTNKAPTIIGTAPGQVLAGVAYAFQPSAADADNDTLSYGISGQPPWASFSTTTGRLSGTPTAADVGTYSNIVITVSDGTAQVALPAFTVTVVATATGSATLSWTPPTQNTDGSALTDLAGYRVYWGTSQGNLASSVTLNNPGLTSYVIDQLTPGTWYFTATALNSVGVESNQSNIASKVVQ